MATSDSLPEVRRVSQSDGVGKVLFAALDDVNPRLRDSEFVAVLGGLSGCGKSTLLRFVALLQRPTEGRVFYRGEPLQGTNPHGTSAFQTTVLFPWPTVQDNVEIALKAQGVPSQPRAARRVPGSLIGGQGTRVGRCREKEARIRRGAQGASWNLCQEAERQLDIALNWGC